MEKYLEPEIKREYLSSIASRNKIEFDNRVRTLIKDHEVLLHELIKSRQDLNTLKLEKERLLQVGASSELRTLREELDLLKA